MLRLMYDASEPPKTPPDWAVVAGYIGGGTPHVWTPAEWGAQPARYRLPIWVYVGLDSQPNGHLDAASAVQWLVLHGVRPGVSVALDTETRVLPKYIDAFDSTLAIAGYHCINYGSLKDVIHNPITTGGRWSAHWDDQRHLDAGHNIVATQFADAKMLGTDYDGSVIDSSVHLWDTHPHTLPAPGSWEAAAYARTISIRHDVNALASLLSTHPPKAA